MAAPGDIFGPQQPIDMGVEEPAPSPWGWVPASWLDVATPGEDIAAFGAPPVEQPAPPTVAGAQPGLGVPAQTVDDAFKGAMGGEAPPIVLPWMRDMLGIPEPLPEQPAPAPVPTTDVTFDADVVEVEEPSVDDRARYLADLDTDSYEILRGKQEAARQNYLATRQLEESQRQREALERNERNYADATATAERNSQAVAAEAERLAQTKVDPGRWWASRSTGQKIAGFLSAIIGGLYQGRTGAANNAGLDAIQQAIDRDIDAQRADLMNQREMLGLRRGMVGEQFERAGNAFHAAEAVRIASWGQVINQLEAEAQQYDPRGTTAMNIATTIRDARARQAALLQKLQGEERERALKEAVAQEKARQAQAKLDEDIRHNKKTERLDGWRIQVDKQDKEERRAIDAGRLILDQQKVDAEVAKLQAEGKTKEAQYVKEHAVPGVFATDDKGNQVPVVVDGSGTEDLAKTRDKVYAARQLVSILDRVKRLRTGWTSDIAGSEELKQLRSEWSAARLVAKDAFGLGVIAGPDLDLIDGFLGTSDPTKYRDPGPGIDNARQRIIKITDDYLHSRSNQKFKFEIPNAEEYGPPPASEDKEALDLILSVPKPSIEELAELAPTVGIKQGSSNDNEYAAFLRDRQTQIIGANGDMTPKQKRALDEFARMTKNPDITVRQRGYNGLSRAKDNAVSPGVKERAEKLLADSLVEDSIVTGSAAEDTSIEGATP